MDSNRIIAGKNSLIISAPHAFSHKRKTLDTDTKQEEKFTDAIVEKLSSNLNCFGIVATKDGQLDPNFYKISEGNSYKKELQEIIKKNGIKYLVDIHGLDEKYPYDFAIYYKRKYFKSRKFAEMLANSIPVKDLRHATVFLFNFPNLVESETISEFCNSNFHIPAVQIEIARYIREDEELLNCLIENLTTGLQQQLTAD